MKPSKNTLDPRCAACLLAVLVVVIILEPVGLFFSGVFLWIWANNDGKSYRRSRRRNAWLSDSDDAINKPHWSDSNGVSSWSSSGGTTNDLISNPAYSNLRSNIYHHNRH